MNRRVLIDGYQPSRSGGSWERIKPGHRAAASSTVDANEQTRAPSGPAANEKLPKTGSSIQVPKKR